MILLFLSGTAIGLFIGYLKFRRNEELFVETVKHIRRHGIEGPFYNKKYIYFEEDGLVYWTMGAPIEETTIINRCPKENTYEYRLKKGTLP